MTFYRVWLEYYSEFVGCCGSIKKSEHFYRFYGSAVKEYLNIFNEYVSSSNYRYELDQMQRPTFVIPDPYQDIERYVLHFLEINLDCQPMVKEIGFDEIKKTEPDEIESFFLHYTWDDFYRMYPPKEMGVCRIWTTFYNEMYGCAGEILKNEYYFSISDKSSDTQYDALINQLKYNSCVEGKHGHFEETPRKKNIFEKLGEYYYKGNIFIIDKPYHDFEAYRVQRAKFLFEDWEILEEKLFKEDVLQYVLNLKFDYDIATENVTLVSCDRKEHIDLPNTYERKPITHIGKKLFQHGKKIEEITLPDSLTCIRTYAFDGCINLKSIDIPDTVSEIGRFAFRRCRSLKSIHLPDSLTEIKTETFRDCNTLESIDLPKRIEKIGLRAFLGCTSLKKVVIPKSVNKIASYAFKNCPSLNEVYVPKELRNFLISKVNNTNKINAEYIFDYHTSIVFY